MMFLHASAFLWRLFNHVVSRRRSELCQRLKHGLFLLCDDGQELRAAAGLLKRVAEEPLAVWIHTGLLQFGFYGFVVDSVPVGIRQQTRSHVTQPTEASWLQLAMTQRR